MKETRSHAFSLLIDFWLFLGQSLSALKIFEQILQKCSLTDYSISLLVLITSTALSSLSFFSESLANKGDKERRDKKVHTALKYSSFFCAIVLLIESGLLFLLTIGVPYFAKYFPMIFVYLALIIVPLRQLLNCIYDCINLWSKGE